MSRTIVHINRIDAVAITGRHRPGSGRNKDESAAYRRQWTKAWSTIDLNRMPLRRKSIPGALIPEGQVGISEFSTVTFRYAQTPQATAD
ncbi:MAG: hypothetical protein H6Q05_966 [Acidobacteria bacterium]|nr:hypothetical protein [Acidobacteriota bacterium]